MTLHDEDAYREELDEVIEARLRALGTRTPRCRVPGCPEEDPLALTGVHPDEMCQEHLADARGKGWLDSHHAAGRSNDPATVAIPANDHARISHGYQALWPRETLRNPDGSPLLRAAAAIRGWLDVLRLMLDHTIAWIPGFLETLDAWLLETIGPGWWQQMGGG